MHKGMVWLGRTCVVCGIDDELCTYRSNKHSVFITCYSVSQYLMKITLTRNMGHVVTKPDLGKYRVWYSIMYEFHVMIASEICFTCTTAPWMSKCMKCFWIKQDVLVCCISFISFLVGRIFASLISEVWCIYRSSIFFSIWYLMLTFWQDRSNAW
jgi:hypothetical protein